MYLKEIITNGFKSFADKMTISLNDEITCIVGPNGSGKSNVVDAVRWVLGEQSVRTLRGDGSMSDVIFAGSASRKAKNAASVELVFDNTDHYLPLDFSEVSVKRRVFRTGENEYFINNKKCRLKDISDLFLDSGIGKESFNIISQGEVEKVLSESKEERRAIFEEAAGILKYKKRKNEALKKLDRTHDSLDRVEDIISELEAQLHPLEEQSNKAKEYLDTKELLEKLEIALFAYDIYHFTHEEEMKKKRVAELEEEITSFLHSSSVSSSEEEKKRTALLQQEKELEFTQKELLQVTEDVSNLKGELNLLKVEREKKGTVDQTDQIRQLHMQKGTYQKELSLLEEKQKNADEGLTSLKEELETAKQQLNEMKIQKKHFDQEYSKNDREILTCKHKIDLLKAEEERGDYLPQAVREVLKQDHLQGIYDTIGHLVSTEEEYAKALDVALASSKNFLVVKNQTCAKEAIQFLKKNNLGRATFFPLDVITSRYVDAVSRNKVSSLKGYCGVLSDFVSCDDRFRSIIENQLGTILIAEDMNSALQISHTINQKYKIITLSGDVLHVGGSMTGGSFYKGKSSVVLKQEQQSLQDRVSALQSLQKKNLVDLEEINEKISQLEEKFFTCMKRKEQKEEEIISLQQKKKEERSTYDELVRNLEMLEQDETGLEEKEKALIDRFYQKSAYKEKLEEKYKTTQKKISEIKKEIEDIQANNKYQNSIQKKKEEEKNQLEMEINRIDVKLDMMLRSLSEDYSMTYEKARENYSLEMEPEEARNKVNSYRLKLKDLGMVNLASIEEYERVHTRYEFLFHQKEDLLKAESTLLDIMREMDEVMKEEFLNTFELIRKEWKEVFKELFHGGEADLTLTDPDNLLETGVNIMASPPGKKLSTIHLLSGGEKTLTAISLLFAILNIRKIPFCIFDEVEAALDEANVERFGTYLEHYKHKTQFLIITHKKKTMEYADTLYGITMQESGVSKLVSVKLKDYEELI